MKRITIITIAVAFLITGSAYSFPQEAQKSALSTYEPVDYDGGVLLFGTARYDDGFLASLGAAKHIGNGVWDLPYVDAGQYGSAGNDIAKVWELSDRFAIGLLAGPGVDWIQTAPDNTDPLAYFVGASGALVSLRISEKWYLNGFAKWRFDFTGSEVYKDGLQGGVGVGYWFKFPNLR